MSERPTMGQMLDACLADALKRFTPTKCQGINVEYFDQSQAEVYLHTQAWPDTSCGFGGVGGQAFCSAPCVVVMSTFTHETCVYHAGRFAYRIPIPNDAFFECLANHKLPGAAESWSRLARPE